MQFPSSHPPMLREVRLCSLSWLWNKQLFLFLDSFLVTVLSNKAVKPLTNSFTQ